MKAPKHFRFWRAAWIALAFALMSSPAYAAETSALLAPGPSQPIAISYIAVRAFPPGIFVTFAPSTVASCTVQATADANPTASSNWQPADPGGSLTNLTASTNAKLGAAVSALRLNCSALSAGSVTFGVVQ